MESEVWSQKSGESPLEQPLENRLIFGDGEMAELVRNFDWEKTPLGPIASWSDVLRSTVNTLLATRTPIFLWWGKGLTQFYNDAYRASLGSDKHPLALGQNGKDCWPEIWPVVAPEIEAVMHQGIASWHEDQLVPIYREGVLEDVYWTYSYSPVRESDGSICGVLVNTTETTRRVLAENRSRELMSSLKASEERLRLALSMATGVGTWDWDVVHNLVYADAGFSRTYGVESARGAEGAPIEEFMRNMHPDDRVRVQEEVERAIQSGRDFTSEYRLIQDDGSVRWVLAKGRCTYAEDGTPLRFPGVTVDTTEQKQTAATIAEKGRQLTLAVEGAGLATWFYDPGTNIVGGDEKMRRLFGLPVQEAPAEVWLAAVHRDDRERVGREFASGLRGELYDTAYRICREDGTERWVRAKAQLVVTGTSSRMVGICEDFTDRKLIEDALAQTAARLSMAQQSAKIAAWQWDLATGKLIWDEGSIWSYGRAPSEMSHVDQTFSYLHEDDRERVREELQPSLEGRGEFRSYFRVIWPDGSLHWLQAFGKPVLSEDGKPVAIFGINMNVTERKLAENALLQSEKLAAVGRLASSIAHEINNPLESVTNLLYLARTAPDPSAIDGYLESAERELRRVSAITNQTLRFYKQTTGPSSVACSELFSETLSLYQGRLLNSNITVEKRKRASRSTVCFEGEIRQVLSNLMSNAIDAMPHGGRLILRSREATDWATGVKGLALTVADTGAGMPSHVRRKVFEAFFSTKGIGGTGLGLWVSKELVEKHHGKLMVRSSTQPQHHGTVFSVFLPFETVSS